MFYNSPGTSRPPFDQESLEAAIDQDVYEITSSRSGPSISDVYMRDGGQYDAQRVQRQRSIEPYHMVHMEHDAPNTPTGVFQHHTHIEILPKILLLA